MMEPITRVDLPNGVPGVRATHPSNLPGATPAAASAASLGGSPVRDQVTRLEQFASTLAQVGAAPDLERALDALLRGTMALLDADDGVAHVFDPLTKACTQLLYVDREGVVESVAQPGPPPPGSFSAAIRDGGPEVLVEDLWALPPETFSRYHSVQHGLRSTICVPLDAGPQRIGCLQVDHHEPGFFGPADLTVAAALAAQAGAVVERARLDTARRQVQAALEASERRLRLANARLRRLSTIDGLTGIANRRAFDAHLAREWRRAERHQWPVALVMFDIDYFKRYNDAYGHPAGDACLRRVARAIGRRARRAGDLAARYGGEEFVLLLSETSVETAARIAAAVRASLASPGRDAAASRPGASRLATATVSAGVASIVPTRSTAPQALIAAADAALYRAKALGRDRVEVHESLIVHGR